MKTGWGKRLIDLQEQDASWAHALYLPKWTSTFYTLLLLKRFAATRDKRLVQSALLLLDKGFYEPDGGINYWKTWRQGECCVTGMLLSMVCYFKIQDDRIQAMLDYLLTQQMDDGGWNCEKPNGACHSSFHTTISVLEGLAEYKRLFSENKKLSTVDDSVERAIEFLLQHHLYKSSTTLKTVHPDMIKLSFPPRWRYDILRCLDYFQSEGVAKDERMRDAVNLLYKKQTKEGYWRREKKYPGKVFFDMENGKEPSQWNTLRVLRVVQWWEK